MEKQTKIFWKMWGGICPSMIGGWNLIFVAKSKKGFNYERIFFPYPHPHSTLIYADLVDADLQMQLCKCGFLSGYLHTLMWISPYFDMDICMYFGIPTPGAGYLHLQIRIHKVHI